MGVGGIKIKHTNNTFSHCDAKKRFGMKEITSKKCIDSFSPNGQKKEEKSKKCFFLKLPINREGIEPKSYCDLYWLVVSCDEGSNQIKINK